MDLTDELMSAKTPTVYVVQQGGKNILPALAFGSLVPLLEDHVQVHLNARTIIQKMKDKLATYSDDDYILAIGDPVAIGIACAVAAQVNHGRFIVLKWDRQESTYFPVHVTLND